MELLLVLAPYPPQRGSPASLCWTRTPGSRGNRADIISKLLCLSVLFCLEATWRNGARHSSLSGEKDTVERYNRPPNAWEETLWREYIVFKNVHVTLSWTEHMIGHKTSLKTEIIQSSLSNHNEMKLEIFKKRKVENSWICGN